MMIKVYELLILKSKTLFLQCQLNIILSSKWLILHFLWGQSEDGCVSFSRIYVLDIAIFS